MSTARPESLQDWAAYLATLDGARLARKARAANSVDFAARLQEEGLTPDEVESFYVLLARQMARAGVRLTDEGLYSFRDLATRQPPVRVVLPPQSPPVAEEIDED